MNLSQSSSNPPTDLTDGVAALTSNGSVSWDQVPRKSEKYSFWNPRVAAAPKPWLLCMLRLRAASSPKDSPTSGSHAPKSTQRRLVVSKPPDAKNQLDVFHTTRETRHAGPKSVRYVLEAALSDAQTAICADAVWWPCVLPGTGEKRVTTTWGLLVRSH